MNVRITSLDNFNNSLRPDCPIRKDGQYLPNGNTHKSGHLFLIPVILFLLLHSFGLAANSERAASSSLDRLLDAIEQVESSGRAKAIGDGGRAHGAYQLHKCYVDDVNRILGRKVYTYADRMNRTKSREMTRVYLTHYAKVNKLTCPIQISRLHNGGSTGHKKQATLKYATKIRKAMK